MDDINISTAVSESERLKSTRHNKEVEENRKYLKNLINAVLYLCKQELPLRGHDESCASLNKGNYRELLETFGKIDNHFHDRLHSNHGTHGFTGVSSSIQNDLIQSVANVVTNEIKDEVKTSPLYLLRRTRQQIVLHIVSFL